MIRYHNGLVLSMADGPAPIPAELWTDGDKISYIGPVRADAPDFEREIDLGGGLLMPGFKNAHAHSAMTFLRSYADDLPLQSWLFDKVFPLEEELSAENIYVFTKLAIMEYLSSGITSSFDMYFFNDEYARAIVDTGFRGVICAVAGSNSTPDFESIRHGYEHFNSLHPRLSYKLGFHAEYTSRPEVLRELSQLAAQYKAPVWTHNSETRTETEDCKKRHGGLSPTEYFDSLGLYDNGGGGYHCVYLSDNDMDIFKKRGLWAVSCPGSNSKLASGIAPLTRFMEKGLNLALGTDGPASNNALDMFREMYLACVLQKLSCSDAAACDAFKILEAATLGGARAMGLFDCDALAVGKQADMVVIDLDRPNMRPLHNIAKNLVYSGSKENVRMTVVAGRILYEKGEFFIGDEPGRIYAEAERMTKEIISNA